MVIKFTQNKYAHAWHNFVKSYGYAKDCKEGKQRMWNFVWKIGCFHLLSRLCILNNEKLFIVGWLQVWLSNFICNYFCGMASKFALCLRSHFSKYSHNFSPIRAIILPFTVHRGIRITNQIRKKCTVPVSRFRNLIADLSRSRSLLLTRSSGWKGFIFTA